MTVSITHALVSTVPDDGDSGIVSPNDWNDNHVATVTATGTTTARNFDAWAADCVVPEQFGSVGSSDDTAVIQAAINRAIASGKTLLLTGSYNVTSLTMHTTNSATPLNVIGSATLVGVASSAKTALLDISGYVSISGQISAYGKFSSNYSYGIWVHGDGASSANGQYSDFSNVTVSGFFVGWRIGDAAYPAATISEITIHGGHIYGCPVAVQAEGTNTVVTFVGSEVLDSGLAVINTGGSGWFYGTSTTSNTIAASGTKTFTTQTGLTISAGMPLEIRSSSSGHVQDYMTGTVSSYNSGTGSIVISITGAIGVGNTYTAWYVQPAMAIVRSIGATISIVGGEVQQPQQYSNGFEIRPLEPVLGDNLAIWGKINCVGANCEVVAVLLNTINPSSLTIDTSHQGFFGLTNVTGFNSQDVAPYINTSSDFTGQINISGCSIRAASTRSNADIAAGSSSTTVYETPYGLGPGFLNTTAGITGSATVKAFNVTDDTATNSTFYPVLSQTSTNGANPKVSSTKLTYNPSTGVLGASAFNMGTATGLQGGGITILSRNNSTGAVTLSSNAQDVSIRPATGNVNIGTSGSITGQISLLNATSGALAITAPSTGALGASTITLPIGTTDFSLTSGLVKQASSGAAFTVGQAAISSDISGLGTGVATALAVNTGTSGCFVVNGGALGTPTSGTATNLSGTASSLTAGNATNVGVTDDTTTNATMDVAWLTSNSGNLPVKVSSTKLNFNPSTGTFGATVVNSANGHFQGGGIDVIARNTATGAVTISSNAQGITISPATSVAVNSALAATGALTAFSGTAIPAGGTAGDGLLVSSTANFGIFFGSGAPTLSAAKGSLYLRSDGSTTNDRAYINTNGSTTWTALTTAA